MQAKKPKQKRGPKKKDTSAVAAISFRLSHAEKAAFMAKHGKAYTKVLRDFVRQNS